MNPNIGLLLGFSHFYQGVPPANRIDLLKNISKIDLITELAACNFRIKHPTVIRFSYPVRDQLTEIDYHLRLNPVLKNQATEIFNYHLEKTNPGSLIFNRAGILFSINEIIESDSLMDIDNYKFSGLDQERIFNYLLLVNDEITRFNSDVFTEDFSQFEKLNLASLPLNEYFIPIDPFFTLYRSNKLLNYLSTTTYGAKLSEYIFQNTNLSIDDYTYELTAIIIHASDKKNPYGFYFRLPEGSTKVRLFDFLSKRVQIPTTKEIEFLGLKKSPFYKTQGGGYILLDNMLVLSKSYDFFIWDFLNDKLLDGISSSRERTSIIKDFKAIVGKFFEEYIREILINTFNQKTYSLRTFDQLKFRKDKKEFEFADLYIRKDNKVILGQAKTTSLKNAEKYSELLSKFYKPGDKDDFYRRHGLFQLRDSIQNLSKHGRSFDRKLKKCRLKVFPLIIFNEISLNNVFFFQMFHDRFQELIKDFDEPCIKVYPLSFLHISDLEALEEILKIKNRDIFKIFISATKMEKIKLPFFHIISDLGLSKYPDRLTREFHTIIDNHNSIAAID